MQTIEKHKEFIDIYLKWRKGMDWISKQENPHEIDIADLKTLEKKVDYLWIMLSDSDRSTAFEWLIEDGFFSQDFKEILEACGGRVTNLKAEVRDQDVYYS